MRRRRCSYLLVQWVRATHIFPNDDHTNQDAGQSASALQTLGAGALTYGRFGDYNKGDFLTMEAAKALSPACTLLALLLNGLGIIWLAFGIICTVERALKKELRWNPTWVSISPPYHGSPNHAKRSYCTTKLLTRGRTQRSFPTLL